MTIKVRSATPDDAARIAKIHVEGWRHTYSHVLDGTVVGFAAAGPGRGDDAPADLELYAIYQQLSAHSSGTGRALLDVANGAKPAFLWVAEANPRAQAFYRRNGFNPDGA